MARWSPLTTSQLTVTVGLSDADELADDFTSIMGTVGVVAGEGEGSMAGSERAGRGQGRRRRRQLEQRFDVGPGTRRWWWGRWHPRCGVGRRPRRPDAAAAEVHPVAHASAGTHELLRRPQLPVDELQEDEGGWRVLSLPRPSSPALPPFSRACSSTRRCAGSRGARSVAACRLCSRFMLVVAPAPDSKSARSFTAARSERRFRPCAGSRTKWTSAAERR